MVKTQSALLQIRAFQLGFPGGREVKNPHVSVDVTVRCKRCGFDPWSARPLEEEMATQLQYSCLEHPMDAGALQATSHGVAKGGMLCPLSESPSRKREDLHDNATRKGREIYCLLEPGPLLQPTQWCKGREPRAPVSTHIYRVLDFKHKQWVVGASGLVTCLQSTFIGTNFRVCGAFQGTFPEVYRARTD